MNGYTKYLNETIATLKEEEAALVEENRKDEANFIRVKSNICEICKTIYRVSSESKTGEELKEEYLRRLTRLPENWKISLGKAKEHGEIQKVIIEEIKLEMLQELVNKFEEIGV